MRLIRALSTGLIICVAPIVAWSATLDVDQADPGCSDSACTPCCTIQGAVAKSSGGDVISVGPGTYPENVDFRNMLSVGDITLEAASGPGTVLVSPATGHTLRHGGGTHDLVTIDGIDFSSGPGSACVYLDHSGGAVLYDIDASNCGYTAFLLDNTGNITMRRCTADSNARHGIQIDGASGAYLEDCTTSSNTMDGVLIINVDAMVELVGPTAVDNTAHGLDFDLAGPLIINGATVTDNGGRGIWASSTSMVYIQNSDIQRNDEVGIDIEWNGVEPVDSVTLTNTTVSNNGLVANDSGVRLREITGPITVTDCFFDNNGIDGLSVEISVVGDLEIVGGHADANTQDGFDLRNVGGVTVTGVTASGNTEKGIAVDSRGSVTLDDCVANDNENNAGIAINWQDPEPVDGVSITNCTANRNGLNGGGNGIYIQNVFGAVSVVGTTTNGNSRTGVRVDSTAGSVLIRDAVSNAGLEEGFKIDADVGPVTVMDSVADGNATDGLVVRRENVDVESLYVRRNSFVSNAETGVDLLGLGGSGLMSVQCNDIAGNNFGIYLDSFVTVDARKVWWGSTTGPGGQGSGTGDGVFAEPGGTITFDPWLPESIWSPTTTCDFFSSGFESGLLEEWDLIVD